MAEDYDAEIAEWQAIAQGNQDAFSRWFARCEIQLRRSLRSFARTIDVEAVVQETVMKVWELAATIGPRGRPDFLLHWAQEVAKNHALNRSDRAKREVPLEAHHDLPTRATVSASDPILRARIRECLAALSASTRRVLEARLHDAGQHSDRDLSAMLGMSYDTFRKNLSRAREALEQCLREHGIDLSEYLK